MKIINKTKKAILHPNRIFFKIWVSFSKYIKSDRLFLTYFYFLYTLKKMDFLNPISFTQKIQCLKLINTSSLCTKMVDKYQVREIIEGKIGAEYLIPLIGVWDDFDMIEFNSLPNQFVLKTTHDSGTVIVCKDKTKLNLKKSKNKINKSLKRNYFWAGREYPYKNVKPRIIAEKFMSSNDKSDLIDYKFFCFNGEPKFIQIDTDRFSNHKRDFYNLKWEKLPFNSKGYKHNKNLLLAPSKLEEMIDISKKLSENFIFLRVDLYFINNKIYFGELTFHHGGGLEQFYPNNWDIEIGKMIKIN